MAHIGETKKSAFCIFVLCWCFSCVISLSVPSLQGEGSIFFSMFPFKNGSSAWLKSQENQSISHLLYHFAAVEQSPPAGADTETLVLIGIVGRNKRLRYSCRKKEEDEMEKKNYVQQKCYVCSLRQVRHCTLVLREQRRRGNNTKESLFFLVSVCETLKNSCLHFPFLCVHCPQDAETESKQYQREHGEKRERKNVQVCLAFCHLKNKVPFLYNRVAFGGKITFTRTSTRGL